MSKRIVGRDPSEPIREMLRRHGGVAWMMEELKMDDKEKRVADELAVDIATYIENEEIGMTISDGGLKAIRDLCRASLERHYRAATPAESTPPMDSAERKRWAWALDVVDAIEWLDQGKPNRARDVLAELRDNLRAATKAETPFTPEILELLKKREAEMATKAETCPTKEPVGKCKCGHDWDDHEDGRCIHATAQVESDFCSCEGYEYVGHSPAPAVTPRQPTRSGIVQNGKGKTGSDSFLSAPAVTSEDKELERKK